MDCDSVSRGTACLSPVLEEPSVGYTGMVIVCLEEQHVLVLC